ncbi:hypothetical protein AKJ18_37335, partial [Vibrio xuii]
MDQPMTISANTTAPDRATWIRLRWFNAGFFLIAIILTLMALGSIAPLASLLIKSLQDQQGD